MIGLLAILTFVAAFLLVFGVNLLLTDMQTVHRQSVRKRLDEEWRTQNRQRAKRDLSESALIFRNSSTPPSRRARGAGYGERLEFRPPGHAVAEGRNLRAAVRQAD